MPENLNAEETAPHARVAADVASAMGTDTTAGLSSSEAQARLERLGANELEREAAVSAWRRFLLQFKDALVLLLVAAAVISCIVWAVERETSLPYEGLVIITILLLNAILGFLQEGQAEKALASLRAMAAPEASLVRDGVQRRLVTRDLVPGDLLIINEGDTVPADARLLAVAELQTLEASLTGESSPVTKSTQPVASDAGIGDRLNMIFAGTTVSFGHGRAVVTATGMSTELGRIAGMLKTTKSPTTPLQRELDRLGKQLGTTVVVIAAVVVASLLMLYGAHDAATVVQVLMFGVALAVAAAPEGLAAVVTVVLAMGVQRMARRGAIVRKLPAVEALGSATIIASDKTGTLTRNEMTVRVLVTAAGRVDVTGTGYSPEGALLPQGLQELSGAWKQETDQLLQAAVLANNAQLNEKQGAWSIQGDPTEGALLSAARKAGLEAGETRGRFPRLSEAAFSSERKLMSTVNQDGGPSGHRLLFTKGAPGTLLERCTHELSGEKAVPLTPERRAQILLITEEMAAEALRTLGTASRSLDSEDSAKEAGRKASEFEHGLTFLGLIGMIDPPRPEAGAAVERAKAAGIRPMLITGDHPGTAVAIARELGISSDDRVLTGTELERMSEPELAKATQEISVYARVNPKHKLRIVKALQGNGEIVAMTGDGVNDAPALKSSDIGVAMGITGTDVSKEAADLVLTDDNFATIVAAVEEGRAVFSNIRKFLEYLLSSNAGEVLTVFLSVVLARPLGLGDKGTLVLPLLATQILWINLLTDGAPALALGVDPAEPDLMRRPPRPRSEGVINAKMRWDIAIVGLVMAAGTLLVFDAALPGGFFEGPGGIEYGRTMAFTTLMLFQLFNAFNARSDAQSAFRGLFRNGWMWAAVGLSIALHFLVIYVPFLQAAFGTVRLSGGDWFRSIAVASSVLWIVEGMKLVARIKQRPETAERAGEDSPVARQSPGSTNAAA
ncbi:cation-translocating P-type ATPase [Paludibaculum fermentans]|uniref:cation-translocating P-type ATPase n=1 Tax=Paludibaculum fermentans TaxID=1473598 RepID=UPI003EBAE720